MEAPKTNDKAPMRPPLTAWQVLAVAGVVVALLVGLDFNQRLATEQHLVESVAQARATVNYLEAEHGALLTQVAYATTDAAVVQWAHESGKMVQSGEVLVVPKVPTPQPTPIPAAPPPPPPPPTWELWQNLFFDTPRATP